jgi:hypothetical protein
MARCPECGEVIATGSLCTVDDSDCIVVGGDGSEATPFILEPVLDPDGDNLLTCGTDGLLVELPESLTNPPACQAFSSVNLSIINDTLTAVTFNSERFDTHGMHSPSVNPTRITIPAGGDGVYVVNFVCAFGEHLTGDRLAYIRKNGTTLYPPVSKPTAGTWFGSSGITDADLETGLTIEIEDDFVATDYVEALVRQTSGGTLTLVSESYSPVLTVVKI